MITPDQIREKKISTVANGGYDRYEVNQFLTDIIQSYETVCEENKELYRKLEILANRIEEYRADEDSIKTALISAQKMASKVTSEAKEKAEQTISDSVKSAQQTVVDAKEKADKIVGEARDYVAALTKEKTEAAEEIIAQANKTANDAIEGAKVVSNDVLAQAKKLANEIVGKAKSEKDYYSAIVSKLKDESSDFKTTLISLYETQLDKIKELTLSTDTYETENENIESLENELNSLLADIEDEIEEDEVVAEEKSEVPPTAEEMIDEPAENEEIEDSAEDEEIEEISDESEDMDEVDDIIDEIESTEFKVTEESDEDVVLTEEELQDALESFTTDELTPVDESAAKSIPVIEDEPEFESSMPFENFFNVNKEVERTDETISLIPPDDEEEDDTSKFRGFFKKKK